MKPLHARPTSVTEPTQSVRRGPLMQGARFARGGGTASGAVGRVMGALASYFLWHIVRAVRTPAALLLGLWLAACGGGSDPAASIVISSSAPPAGTTGVQYPGFGFAVASGGTAPFSFSESGPLPPGLSLALDGTLSGTPTRARRYPLLVT